MKISKLQNPSLRRRKGFTLIELIIVIAILAILAAIAIPAYLTYRNNARISADAATCKVIYDAWLIAEASADTTDDYADFLEGGVMPTPQQGGSFAFSPATGDVDYVYAGSARYPLS